MNIFNLIKEGLIKSVRGECFPFAPSIHRASAALGTNGKRSNHGFRT